jgi:hypothetical protein
MNYTLPAPIALNLRHPNVIARPYSAEGFYIIVHLVF